MNLSVLGCQQVIDTHSPRFKLAVNIVLSEFKMLRRRSFYEAEGKRARECDSSAAQRCPRIELRLLEVLTATVEEDLDECAAASGKNNSS